jgi:pimeloyl-ACP methyl ester carboxylesterase
MKNILLLLALLLSINAFSQTEYEIKELLPQAQVTFIEKCGHFPWLENEKQVSKFYQVLRSALN